MKKKTKKKKELKTPLQFRSKKHILTATLQTNKTEKKNKQKQFACNRFVRHRRYKQHRYYNNVPHRHIMDCNHIANQAISRFHAKTIFYTDSNAFGQPFPIYRWYGDNDQ